MPQVAAAAAIVGAGVSIYGAITSANDQASLDESRAGVARQQSGEIAAREQVNETIRNQAAFRQKLQFGASYAASGKAGTGVGSQLQIQNQTDLANMLSNRESMFQEAMLQQQAGTDLQLADETRSAGTLNAIGAGLGGIARAGGIMTAGGSNPGYGGTQGLGAYPSTGSGSPWSLNVPGPSLGSGRYGGG